MSYSYIENEYLERVTPLFVTLDRILKKFEPIIDALVTEFEEEFNAKRDNPEEVS